MTQPRRSLLAAAALLPLAKPGWAQAWPTRPVRLLVPFIPGSAPDVIARTLAERLGPALGQPVVIENRAGAGGNIGFAWAARQAPDGYTLLLGTSSMVINPSLYARVDYDPIRDFVPINLTYAMPHLLVVPNASPARDTVGLVALLKADPALTYASGGYGSGAHLAAELLLARAGVRAVHVPYRGAPDIINAVLAGQVAFGMPTMSTAVPLVQAGQMRALAVSSATPSPVFPTVPPMKDAVPGAELVSWFGILAPAGTPAPVVAKVDAAIRAILADPAFVARVSADGTMVLGQDAAAFAAMLPGDAAAWAELVQISGARVE
jgi:tripartite-type tricarboxylate transporter receptor subunit TctC